MRSNRSTRFTIAITAASAVAAALPHRHRVECREVHCRAWVGGGGAAVAGGRGERRFFFIEGGSGGDAE